MLTRYTKKVDRYLRNTCGVSALEYAILIGIVAVALSAALVTFSDNITSALTNIGGKVASTKVDSGTAK